MKVVHQDLTLLHPAGILSQDLSCIAKLLPAARTHPVSSVPHFRCHLWPWNRTWATGRERLRDDVLSNYNQNTGSSNQGSWVALFFLLFCFITSNKSLFLAEARCSKCPCWLVVCGHCVLHDSDFQCMYYSTFNKTSKVTAPQDAHGMLVLQVYLGFFSACTILLSIKRALTAVLHDSDFQCMYYFTSNKNSSLILTNVDELYIYNSLVSTEWVSYKTSANSCCS